MIITEVFGHPPVWRLGPLSFTSSSGLREPPTSSAINLGPFQVRIRPWLLRLTETTAMITLASAVVQLKLTDGSDYLLHFMLKLTISTEGTAAEEHDGK